MKKAFTLIELLVVIAIIAILAAILFPVFAQAKAAAKASANLSNLKQNGLAVIQYGGDSDDVFPIASQVTTPVAQAMAFGDSTGANMNTTPVGAIPWQESIYPYTKSRDIYTSPIEGGSTTASTTYRTSFAKEQFYGVVPSAASINLALGLTASTYSFPGPYSKGAYIDGPFGYSNNASGTLYASASKSQTSIDKVAEVVMISDAGAFDMGFLQTPASTGSNSTPQCSTAPTPGPAWQNTSIWVGPWGRKNASGPWGGGKTCNSTAYTTGNRGQVTSCFTDGHAASLDISRLYELRSIDGSTTNIAAYRLYTGTTQ